MILVSLAITGARVREFLQAYTTGNWSATETPSLQWTAFLNNHGRVVAFCAVQLIDQQKAICLLPADNVANLMKHLQPYTFFSRIQIKPCDELLHCEWRIDSPTPWITSEHSGLYTVHDLSLDCLGYVSFKKGCYLGQEIVARVHARVSDHKKRLALLPKEGLIGSLSPLYMQENLVLVVINKNDFLDLSIARQIWDNSPAH